MLVTRTDLIIMACLSEQPAHGWDIDRRLVEMGADLWAEYSRPNLYYALRKLERGGMIERVKQGAQGLRKPYRITARGQAALHDTANLEQLFQSRTYFDFDLILGFAGQLASRDTDWAALIERRQEELSRELDRAQELWQQAEMTAGISFGRQAAMRHRIKFLKSEMEFVKWLAKNAPEDWTK